MVLQQQRVAQYQMPTVRRFLNPHDVLAASPLEFRLPKRRTYNDIIGWQVSVLGTTYAVILGFMLYTVWSI